MIRWPKRHIKENLQEELAPVKTSSCLTWETLDLHTRCK